jgi:four helix bundle protein
MERVKSFKDLIVWQLASKLAKDIATELVGLFPKEEKFRLGDQMIRSSRSVPSQIAEGFRKSSLKDKHHYYEIESTSNDETENHLVEAKNNGFIDNRIYRKYLNRIIKVRILLSRLRRSIRVLQKAARSAQNRHQATNTASENA